MLDRMTTTKSMEAIVKARVPQQPHHVTKFKHRSVFVSSDKVLRAPRKIGLATTTAQGRRRPGHESQSVLQGKPVFFEVPFIAIGLIYIGWLHSFDRNAADARLIGWLSLPGHNHLQLI